MDVDQTFIAGVSFDSLLATHDPGLAQFKHPLARNASVTVLLEVHNVSCTGRWQSVMLGVVTAIESGLKLKRSHHELSKKKKHFQIKGI